MLRWLKVNLDALTETKMIDVQQSLDVGIKENQRLMTCWAVIKKIMMS